MANFWDVFKKIGASLIVILLILMLAITFSSQPMEEIIALISGASKVGSYRGEPILVKDYSFVYNECESQFREAGLTEIPPQFLQSCIYQNILALYVKPTIAKDLGFEVSKEFVEKQLEDYVKQIYRAQQKRHLKDDLVPIEELYQRELQYLPIYRRIAILEADFVDRFFLQPFPVSEEEKRLFQSSIKIEMEVLAFTNQDLMKNFVVTVSEKEIQEKYEKDKVEFYQKEENKDQRYPTFEERYKYIKELLENEKKQQELTKIKEALSTLKDPQNFAEIESIVKIKPIKIMANFQELSSVVVGDKKINLQKPEFLSSLSFLEEKVIGPITDREITIYAKILDIRKENIPLEKALIPQTQREMSYRFYEYVLEQYKKRGEFQIRMISNEE
ncbi:MAG: hypothetical protein NZ853_10540 [Leptospiraceae bacterium]|nr:hypothetical protein [Leptospiraceae bacterium]MDW7977110.1 hypothetical protein [Leptospiraceae bacterium]